MRKLIIYIFFGLSLSSTAQQWSFVKEIGFMGDNRLQKIKSGKNNDCIGLFRKMDTAATGNINCPVASITETANLVKYDSTGNCLWQKKTQFWQFLNDFDISPNTQIKTIGSASINTYNQSGILIKTISLDASLDLSRLIRCDKKNNYYILTKISDTLRYNNFLVINNSGSTKQYLLKFNLNDSLLWAKQFDFGSVTYAERDFAVDQNNDLIFRGFFSDSLFLNNLLVLTDTGNFSSYLLKLTESGNLDWIKKMSGVAPQGVFVRVDNFNNIYTAGRFCGALTIDTFSIAEFTSGYWCGDAYITKMTPQGDLQWVTRIGNSYSDENIYGFDVSPNGAAYFSGNFGKPLYVNNDSMYQTHYNGYQLYFAKLSLNGKLEWYDYPFTYEAVPSALAADQNENVYFTGMWLTSLFVLAGDSLHTGNCGAYDYRFYLAKNKFNSFQTATEEINNNADITIFPNPTNGSFRIAAGVDIMKKISEVKIYNTFGNLISKSKFHSDHQIDLTTQPAGIYFVEIISEGKRTVKKIILE